MTDNRSHMPSPTQPSNEASVDNTPAGRRQLLVEDMHNHVTAPATHSRASGRFSRTLTNFWLDCLLAASFAALCVVAVLVQFVFPPGIAAADWSLWGLSYGQWCSVQFGLIAGLSLGILVHVMLHWSWICSVLTRRILHTRQLPDDGARTIYGVGLLIGLLSLGATIVAIAQWTIQTPP